MLCGYYSVRRIVFQNLTDRTNLLSDTSRSDNFPGLFFCSLFFSAGLGNVRYVTHPYSRVSTTSAFSMRAFRANGAAYISYSSRLNRLKHAHASRIRQLIAGIISALEWTRPPKCINCVVCLYLWLAAAMTIAEVRGA